MDGIELVGRVWEEDESRLLSAVALVLRRAHTGMVEMLSWGGWADSN